MVFYELPTNDLNYNKRTCDNQNHLVGVFDSSNGDDNGGNNPG